MEKLRKKSKNQKLEKLKKEIEKSKSKKK